MLGHDLIAVPTLGRPPAIIDGSGRKARDRIEHFLRAAIDNENTRRAYGRALGSFFAFLEGGGKERVQDIGPLDVRDYLEAAVKGSPPGQLRPPQMHVRSTPDSGHHSDRPDHLRSVPITAPSYCSTRCRQICLLYQLICAGQYGVWDGDTKRLGRAHVDDEVVGRRLLDG